MITEQERMERQNWIGASDVPALFGLDKYKTLYDLWLSKVEPTEDKPERVGGALWFGNMLEKTVVQMAASKGALENYEWIEPAEKEVNTVDHIKEYEAKDSQWVYYSPNAISKGPVRANLDAVFSHYQGKEGPFVFEAKTKGFKGQSLDGHEWGRGGSGNIPARVLLQVTAQLEVAGYKKALVGLLSGDDGKGLRVYKIPYSKKLGAEILRRAKIFKEEFVDKRVDPGDLQVIK